VARLPDAPFVYPVLDVEWLGGRGVAETARALAEGGAQLIQLRAKNATDRDLLELTRQAMAAARAAGARLVVNDRPDVALLAGADGVHVGQDDVPPAECRRLLGPEAVVGWSTHGPEQLAAAEGLPVDYVALGPIFATSTKADHEPVVGLDGLRRCRPLTRLPLVAIGGIGAESAGAVIAAGADAVAVVSAVMGGADPARAMRALRAALDERR
jgi:thiamine-phosphate pyrophosphorylase